MEKAAAVLCVFGLGMCFSLLGSVSVKLMPRLNIDQGKFGSLISGFMTSCLASSLILGVVTDKLGYGPVAILGFLLTAICILLLARGRTYQAVFLSCVLLGFGAMALNTAGNTLIPVVLFEGKNPAAASNLGNVFFGIGLLLTPLVTSFLFRITSYEKAVSALAVIVAAPVFVAMAATYPESNAAFEFAGAMAILTKPAVLVSGLALFCYAALDTSLCNWLPAFGKEVIGRSGQDMDSGVADASAQRLISVYAIAMIIGRLAASQIPAITEYGAWFIVGASLLTALIVLLMTVTESVRLAWVLVFVAGLASAPFFPTIVGITFAKFSPQVYGSVFGIIFAGALLGGATIPKAIGNLAKGSTVQKSLKLLIPACIILVLLTIILDRL
ncbi:MAG TPA: MFS transporter [bacterium]|nr:MFS transporter [bacterium]HQO33656.1 MFS transporter [bacterium]HQP99948.1 MFS transporter [bacterium]